MRYFIEVIGTAKTLGGPAFLVPDLATLSLYFPGQAAQCRPYRAKLGLGKLGLGIGYVESYTSIKIARLLLASLNKKAPDGAFLLDSVVVYV